MFNRLVTRPSRTAAFVACLLVIVATARAASGGSTGAAKQTGAGSLDACSLLSAADVQASTKQPVRQPAKSVTANLATCAFGDPKDPTSEVVKLNVLVAANAADAKQALAI